MKKGVVTYMIDELMGRFAVVLENIEIHRTTGDGYFLCNGLWRNNLLALYSYSELYRSLG